MTKYIYNNTQNQKIYIGKIIDADSYYLIQPHLEISFANSNEVLTDLAASDIVMSTTTDSSGHITDLNKAIDYLKNNLPQLVETTSTPAFAAKTLVINGVTKKLFARNTGFQQALDQGANTINYSLTYPWCKILGVEVVGAETLDYCDFEVYDNAQGSYSGVPNLKLNQFAYSVNIPKDYYIRLSQFDADIYQGMVIKITYNSVSAKSVGINLIMNEVKD